MQQKGGVVNGTGTVTQTTYAFGTTYDFGGGLALYGELWYGKSKSVGTAAAQQANEGEGLISGVRVKF
jgi:hypothetical protein